MELTLDEMTNSEADIQECIFRIGGRWVMGIQAMDGRILRISVDYCPWCGATLHGKTAHKCGRD